MKVKQIASRPVIACRPEQSCRQAALLMKEHDVGFIVVQDGNGRLAGVLTDRDVCLAASARDLPLRAIPVGDVMSRSVYTVEEEEDVVAAERLMGDRQVRRLPVVDRRGAVVGVLSLNDVVREAERELGRPAPEVDVSSLGRTLGAICRPRQPLDLRFS